MRSPQPAAKGNSAPDRRRYARDYARRRRVTDLARRQLGHPRCVKRWGKHECGGPLQTVTDSLGRSHIVCAWCERHRQGLCLDCSAKVRGRSRRCEYHKRLAIRASFRRYHEQHRDEIRAKARAAYADPAVRERRNAYKRVYRRLHPDLVRAQKRREALRQSKHRAAYHARYRARHREHYRQQARARYYERHPTRPNPTCVQCGRPIAWTPPGRPPKRCLKCLWPCEARRREEAAARKMARIAAAALRPPAKVRPPAHVYRLGDGTHRCVGEGCSARLRGRQKKCDRCKARDLAVARAIAPHFGVGAGRGRRPRVLEAVA